MARKKAARKKTKSTDAVATRLDALIESRRDCLIACAEARAACLEGCDEGTPGIPCQRDCYRANSQCASACNNEFMRKVMLLSQEIGKETNGRKSNGKKSPAGKKSRT